MSQNRFETSYFKCTACGYSIDKSIIDHDGSMECPRCSDEVDVVLPNPPDVPLQITPNDNQFDIKEAIERIRKRLLDLTMRNRLLNFRHTGKSSLRVIDEMHDILFTRLIDGKELFFKGVPDPKKKDLEKYYGNSNEGTLFNNPTVYTEDEKLEAPSAEKWAEHIGLNTSFSLPLTSEEEILDKHQDKYIQTLLYPDQMEAVLRKIAGDAKTCINETGTNMLYISFGFLQWKESTDSDKIRLAPLLLVPVTLTKGSIDAETNTFKYELLYSGEDFTTNLSLKEKLQHDFGLILPEIDNDDLPTDYFIKIKKMIEEKDDWELKPFLTLSLFNFGKILMYLDLNTANKSLVENKTISSLFATHGESLDLFNEEYVIDMVDDPVDIPIINNADSSQHSCVIDAVNGKNLIIEGPPGTGKSQTITNIIGALLHQGKSVLFVAEKLVALEVVRKKLGDANLGEFCLELHSHKTQKSRIMNDLKERLNLPNKATVKFDEIIEEFDELKKELNEYSAILSEVADNTTFKNYSILVRAAKYREEVKGLIDVLDPVTIPLENSKITDVFIGKISDKIQIYNKSRELLIKDSIELQNHPWFGVCNQNLQMYDLNKITSLLEGWKCGCENLSKSLQDLNDSLNLNLDLNFKTITVVNDSFDNIPPFNDKINTELLAIMADAKEKTKVENLWDELKDYSEALECIDRSHNDYNKHSIQLNEKLTALIEEFVTYFKREVSIDCVNQIIKSAKNIQNFLGQYKNVMLSIIKGLNLEFNIEMNSLMNCNAVLRIFSETPIESLYLREDVLEKYNELSEALPSISEKFSELCRTRETLGLKYYIKDLPSLEKLEMVKREYFSGGIFRIFNKNWREARKTYKSVLKKTKKQNNSDKKGSFNGLIKFVKDNQDVVTNESYKGLFGRHYNGLDTKINEFSSIIEWISFINIVKRENFSSDNSFSKGIVSMPLSELKELSAIVKNGLAEKLKELICHVENIESFANSEGQHKSKDVISFSLKKISNVEDIKEFLEYGMKINFQSVKEALLFFESYKKAKNLESKLSSDQLLKKYFPDATKDLASPLSSISFTLEYSNSINLENVFFDHIHHKNLKDNVNNIQQLCSEINACKKNENESRDSFFTMVDFDQTSMSTDNVSVIEVSLRIKSMLENMDKFINWIDYIRAKESMNILGLSNLVLEFEKHNVDISFLDAAFRFKCFDFLAKSILSEYPRISMFNIDEHEVKREKFQMLDQTIMALQHKRIFNQLKKKRPVVGVSGPRVSDKTELDLIKHEISKIKRHIPIRQLVSRAGRSLQALKPCFMMGPLSVAQYLNRESMNFDVLIMDEASQIKPEDALGAMSRVNQVIIVGDKNQLPPTSFFQTIGDVDEEEMTTIEDTESILESAESAFSSKRRLKWHYRSKHPSLIAFSNARFYSNELMLFPSPNDSGYLGVELKYVEGAIYGDQTNAKEAQEIVKSAFEYMQSHPKLSVGIVAMNKKQRDLIELEMEELEKASPHFSTKSHLESSGEEFFIKNLENVQGDERDVIFISFTYGKDEHGNFYQRFGPVNSDKGWRRLNVLYTRARNKVIAFSSMKSADIRIDHSSSGGVTALKDYLSFLETGELPAKITINDGLEPDSVFEEEVIDVLVKNGYECVPQVGVAGYFIDIGVRGPANPGFFKLGIECDGATYHSSKSARDRDRLRQMVLESMGWKIYRIWSADWFKNRTRTMEKLLTYLKSI